jgi:hypothetical protein
MSATQLIEPTSSASAARGKTRRRPLPLGFCLPPVESWRGTSPIQAAKSRPDVGSAAVGCYVNIRDVLARAVIIVGDAFHDDPDGLDEAAISANRLRRVGTRVFLMQLGDDLITARRLQYLARVSGGVYFRRNGNSRRCGRQCRPLPQAARRP